MRAPCLPLIILSASMVFILHYGNVPKPKLFFGSEFHMGDPALNNDTVACVFRQVMKNYHPASSWQAGYIVLTEQLLKVNGRIYPMYSAPFVTGTFENQFLLNDKKTLVNRKVIQVIFTN